MTHTIPGEEARARETQASVYNPDQEIGTVVWASSDEDGPPDVGALLRLSETDFLWFGEITSKEAEAAGISDAGWHIVLHRGSDRVVIGSLSDQYVAHDLIDAVLALAHQSPSRAAGEGVPARMKPWHGGKCAPADWEHPLPVQFRDGAIGYESDTDAWYWGHDGDQCDIIAYTPKASPQTVPANAELSGREGVTKEMREAGALALSSCGFVHDPTDAYLAMRALATPAELPALPSREEMTPEEIRGEDVKLMAAYAGPVVSFEVREPYYLGSCDKCGWVGSTELCGGGDEDVICPRCYTSGADCGTVAEKLAALHPPASVAEVEGE